MIVGQSINSVLSELEKQSHLEKSRRVLVARDDRMLAITKDTGALFHALLIAINANKALELGTSTGYSTLHIARGLLANGKTPKILTIEKNPSKITRAKRNFERASTSKFTKIIHGNILDILKKMPKKTGFDFVLIDADKENAKQYFDLVFPMLRVGGIIATDNMLYPEKYRKIMKRYAKYVAKKPNAWTITLPIGNGEEITIKTR